MAFHFPVKQGHLLVMESHPAAGPLQVQALRDAIAAHFAHAAPESMLVCVDMRRAGVLPPHTLDAYIEIMRRDSPLVARSAYLLPRTGLLAQQVTRMVESTHTVKRRTFTETRDVGAWLGELARPDERRALDVYLALP